jgi:hypothetical protein
MPDDNQSAVEQAARDSRQKAMADNRAAMAKVVEENARAAAERAKEQEAKQMGVQPTPTQRENDLARVGALDIDDKEDDGSGPDPHAPPMQPMARNVAAAAPAAPYSTRAAAPAPAPHRAAAADKSDKADDKP